MCPVKELKMDTSFHNVLSDANEIRKECTKYLFQLAFQKKPMNIIYINVHRSYIDMKTGAMPTKINKRAIYNWFYALTNNTSFIGA